MDKYALERWLVLESKSGRGDLPNGYRTTLPEWLENTIKWSGVTDPIVTPYLEWKVNKKVTRGGLAPPPPACL